MKKGLFTGWQDVFLFTLNQGMKGKGFKGATIGIAFLFFIGLLGINVVVAFLDKEKEVICDIQNVYIVNESNLEEVDFSGFPQFAGSPFENIKITDSDQTIESLNEELSSSNKVAAILNISYNEDGYLLKMIIPEQSDLTTRDASAFLDQASVYFNSIKIGASGLTLEESVVLNSPVSSEVLKAGEESESLAAMLVKMLAPLLFSLIIYTMILLYGQSISKSLMAEKASKLMEVLLVTVRPYAIIAGKIVAMAGIAIFQMLLWILCGVAGFIIGDRLAKAINSEYNNAIAEVFKILGEEGSNAFSIPSLFVAFIALCLGFLLYCVIAGFIASHITKPDDLAQSMAIFQIPVVICWLAAYMLPVTGGYDFIVEAMRYFPPTAAFTLPADLIVGNINLAGGFISVCITFVTILLLMVITGKIYKKNIF